MRMTCTQVRSLLALSGAVGISGVAQTMLLQVGLHQRPIVECIHAN